MQGGYLWLFDGIMEGLDFFDEVVCEGVDQLEIFR
jgi:hypothetical protein